MAEIIILKELLFTAKKSIADAFCVKTFFVSY